MAVFKKHIGMLPLEVCALTRAYNSNDTYEGANETNLPRFRDTFGDYHTEICNSVHNSYIPYTEGNKKILSCDQIYMSTVDYDWESYREGSSYFQADNICGFVCNENNSGISYCIDFRAPYNNTYKSLKFVKNVGIATENGINNVQVLLFSVYFDEPITVTEGQVLTFNFTFKFDESSNVTII